MAYENCLISIPNFGKVRVKATAVEHGVNFFSVTTGEEESRAGKQFHTTHTTSGSFDLSVVFTSYRTYETFMKWLERYTRWMTDPRSPGGPARVVIPARRFDKTGILDEGILYGERVGQFVWRTTLSFIGSRDPLDLTDAEVYLANVSRFEGAEEERVLVRLYPAGGGGANPSSWNALGTVDDPGFRGGQ